MNKDEMFYLIDGKKRYIFNFTRHTRKVEDYDKTLLEQRWEDATKRNLNPVSDIIDKNGRDTRRQVK